MLQQLLTTEYVPGEERKCVLFDKKVSHSRKKLSEADGILTLNDHFYASHQDDMKGVWLRQNRFGFWSGADLQYTVSAEGLCITGLTGSITGFGGRFSYLLRRAEPGEFGATYTPYILSSRIGSHTKRELFKSRSSLPHQSTIEITGTGCRRYLLQIDYADGTAILMLTAGAVVRFRLDMNVTDIKLRVRSAFDKDLADLFYGVDLALDWVQYCRNRSESDLKAFDLAEHVLGEIITAKRVIDQRDQALKEKGHVQTDSKS